MKNLTISEVEAKNSNLASTKSINYGGRVFEVFNIDFSDPMEKAIRDHCYKVLHSGNWCKSMYMAIAMELNARRNSGMCLTNFSEEEVAELYYGFQDYIWHTMPKKLQRYINHNHEHLFFQIAPSYVPLGSVQHWLDKNMKEAIKTNVMYRASLGGMPRGNTAWA